MAPTLLTIPLEIRLQIYAHLLTLTPLPMYRDFRPSSRPLLHPAILLVNHQTNVEATPCLYRDNTFTLHQPRAPADVAGNSSSKIQTRREPAPAPCTLRLRNCLRDLSADVAKKHGTRRFVLQWVWDLPLRNVVGVREMLTGAESVTVRLVLAGTMERVGARRIQVLEGVRGVKRFEVLGKSEGMEEYFEWLRGVVMSEVGSEAKMVEGVS